MCRCVCACVCMCVLCVDVCMCIGIHACVCVCVCVCVYMCICMHVMHVCVVYGCICVCVCVCVFGVCGVCVCVCMLSHDLQRLLTWYDEVPPCHDRSQWLRGNQHWQKCSIHMEGPPLKGRTACHFNCIWLRSTNQRVLFWP